MRSRSALLFVASICAAYALTEEKRDYCIIGGGPGGLQMARLLQQAGRDYAVFEKGRVAEFFRTFPRHRRLISINKRHSGRGGNGQAMEYNLRHDWHSLLSHPEAEEVDERTLFKEVTGNKEYYPHADALVQYNEEWVKRYNLTVHESSEVKRVSRVQGSEHQWEIRVGTPSSGATVGCKWVLVSTGLRKPNMPRIDGIERLSMAYNDMPTDPDFYENKTVAIIGAGNAGFETFQAIMGSAAYVHIHAPSALRIAWETHYVGDVRAINIAPGACLCSRFRFELTFCLLNRCSCAPVDNYQLKSQDAVFAPSPLGLGRGEAAVGDDDTVHTEAVKGDGPEKGKVCLQDSRQGMMAEDMADPKWGRERINGHSLTDRERVQEVDRYCYDVVIRCTGFEVDQSIFNFDLPTKGGRQQRKYPALTPEFESVAHKGLYFMGTLAHVLDGPQQLEKGRQRSSGGFIHGFRYTVRALFKWLEEKNFGKKWPRKEISVGNPSKKECSSKKQCREGHDLSQVTKRIVERMDTSSALYQMFGYLGDLVILPPRGKDGKFMPETSAEYLEELPLDLIGGLFVDGREYLLLTMEYGPDFHGHERVLKEERVFHDFDPKKAHESQFLHPIVRHFVHGVEHKREAVGSIATASEWAQYRGEAVAHHVLEDIFTNFAKPITMIRPLDDFLSTIAAAPRRKPGPWLATRWPGPGPHHAELDADAEDRREYHDDGQQGGGYDDEEAPYDARYDDRGGERIQRH